MAHHPVGPIAMIGTAVAFIVGFKNNATYNRLWEARQIYGAIVNSSRSWTIMAIDFVTPLRTKRLMRANCSASHPARAPPHRLAARAAIPAARTAGLGAHDQSVQPRVPEGVPGG
jgi:hypothetical protein